MKKILLSATTLALLATTASADLIRVEAGAGIWAQEPTGQISYEKSSVTAYDTSSEESTSQMYVWAFVKHFVPIVPNLRVEYSSIESVGKASLTSGSFTTGNFSDTSLTVTQLDIIPYYNILDNTFWTTIDLGIDLKVLDIDYKAGSFGTMSAYEETKQLPLPLGYVRGRVQVPLTGFGVEADIKYVSYDNNTVYDARAKVDYTFDITPIVQAGVEVGYRTMKIETDDTQDIKMNLEFSGFFAGAMLRF